MKNIFLLICLTFIVPQAFTKDLKESSPGYEVISDLADDKIESGYYVVEGKILHASTGKLVKNVKIEIQNGKNVVSKNGYFELKIPITSYYVTFSHRTISETYYENHSIKEKRRIKVIVHAANYEDRIQQVTEKPVVYAYSDVNTAFSLKLLPKGDLIFTYPLLPNDSVWEMSTSQNGNLKDQNGTEFPYLFWDAKQNNNSKFESKLDVFQASILNKKEVLPFLDSILTHLKLNQKEKTDFITYWGPRLVQKEYCFVQFQVNEVCNQFAQYEISPKPDHFNRLYLLFSNLDIVPENLKTQKQNLEPFLRDGFTLIEWGGIELKETDFIENL